MICIAGQERGNAPDLPAHLLLDGEDRCYVPAPIAGFLLAEIAVETELCAEEGFFTRAVNCTAVTDGKANSPTAT
jgi:hypothetical protein